MLIIDYKNKFTVDVDRSSQIDREDFLSIIEFFKKIFLSYNPSVKEWSIDDKRIDEVCLWFGRQGYEYKLTPKAIEHVNEVGKQYACERVVYRDRKFDESILTDTTALFEFQKDAINWLLRRNVSLNATDTGGGKTIETIAVVSQLFSDEHIDSIFIITPDGTQYNWKRSFLNFSTVFKDSDFYIINNDNKIKPFEQNRDKKIMLIATHILKDVLLSYKKGYRMGSSAKSLQWKGNGYCDIKKMWDKKSIACIFDESHLMKHSTSIKTKAILSIKYYFNYRFLLSATPNITRIEDIYTQFKFLDKSLIPFSEKAFKLWLADKIDAPRRLSLDEKEESNSRDIKEVKEVVEFDFKISEYSPSSVEKLRSKYPLVMIQVLKENLPEMKFKKFITPIYLEMNSLQKTLYRMICEEEIETLYEEFDDVKWKLIENKFYQLTMILDCPEVLKNRIYKNEEINKLIKKWDMKNDPKFILLKSKLEDYIENRGEKVIVFDSSPHILDLLYDKFKKYNPLIIHGSLKGVKDKAKDRDEKEYIFNNDPKHKLILLSSHTSSRSINLQKMCHRAIYYSIPLDAEEYRQGQDRVHRITSTHDTYIEPFVMDQTIDITRFNRAFNRVGMNDSMMRNVSQKELSNLLRGIV